MKKYETPQFEKISIVSKEAFTAYPGCYADTWLTGSDAGDYLCQDSSPMQHIPDMCWNAPTE